MVRLHRSFLVRWWILDEGGERIELVHVQSGAKAVTGSLAEALAWMRLSAAGDAAIPDESTPGPEEHPAADEPPCGRG